VAKCERYQPSWVRFGGERRFEGFGKTWNEEGYSFVCGERFTW